VTFVEILPLIPPSKKKNIAATSRQTGALTG
jgi:hypothetical protein